MDWTELCQTLMAMQESIQTTIHVAMMQMGDMVIQRFAGQSVRRHNSNLLRSSIVDVNEINDGNQASKLEFLSFMRILW